MSELYSEQGWVNRVGRVVVDDFVGASGIAVVG